VRDTVGQRFLAAVEASRLRPVTILPSLAAVVRIVPGMPREVTDLADKAPLHYPIGGLDEAVVRPGSDGVGEFGERRGNAPARWGVQSEFVMSAS
jgi:hypothetical protein